MKEKLYSVYMHENKTNHKKYIGITSQPLEARWHKGKNYKNCHAIRRAFEKYGWDGFEHVVLFEGLTKEEACAKEIQLIAEQDTRNPEHGYNICVGGGGTSGAKYTEEGLRRWREKMTGPNNPNYGKPMSEEQKEKLRLANLGKKLTEEHKKKIGDSLRGRKHVSEAGKKHIAETHSRAVIRDDGVVFSSIREASQSIGRCDSAIINAIERGQRSGKHFWKYAEPNA